MKSAKTSAPPCAPGWGAGQLEGARGQRRCPARTGSAQGGSRDVLEHIERVVTHVRRLEHSTETAVQMHFSVQSNRTNDIMRTLTALTAVFLPLNLIAGIFGMNFEFLPLIHQQHGFWWAMAAMGLISSPWWRCSGASATWRAQARVDPCPSHAPSVPPPRLDAAQARRRLASREHQGHATMAGMKRIKTSLFGLFAGMTALWLVAEAPAAGRGQGVFQWRHLLVQYTGLLAMGAMSVAMLLAVRPAWLEPRLHGLDKMYRLHKWLGVAGLVLAITHWWAQGPSGWCRPGCPPARDAGRAPEALEILRLLRSLRGLAENLGEKAFYIAVILIALAR